MFNRKAYITQTEITNQYRIGIKAFKELILAYQIPAVKKDVDLGMYAVVASYFIKEDIEDVLTKEGIQRR